MAGILVLLFLLQSAGAFSEPASPMTDKEVLAGAEARIEQYRKADASILVTDCEGRPVPGVRVKVEQTRHAFLFGCNAFLSGRLSDQGEELAYRDRFGELMNYATLPFYWWSYEAEQGNPKREQILQTAAWCQEKGIRLKGHPLVWNYSEPKWLSDATGEVRSLQLNRITDCVSQYSGTIDTWDVVNEATGFDTKDSIERAPKLTRVWKESGVVEFVRECFRLARNANPKATLIINDNHADETYAALLDKLADDRGNPLYDVIGIQSHMHTGVWAPSRIWKVLDRFGKFRRPIHFTETTIVSGALGWELTQAYGSWPASSTGEMYQARGAEMFYTLLFSHPSVEAITWWDFSDKDAWQGAPAGLVDRNQSAKPVYNRLKNLIKGKWWTRRITRTGVDGVARFRGFLGDYDITVELENGIRTTTAMTLKKGGPNQMNLVVEVPPARHPQSKGYRSPIGFRASLWPAWWDPWTAHGREPNWADYRRGGGDRFEDSLK
jgi:GH35 family endo-1,4-beta-xylanase